MDNSTQKTTPPRKLRIAIEAQRIFRPHKHGMDIAALEMIRALQKIDSYNEYFILVKRDTDCCLNETSNFHIVYLEGRSYPEWEQLSLPRWIRRNHPDLLHCTSNTAPLKVGCPLVLTLHDIIFLSNQNFLSTRGGSAYQRFGNLYRRIVAPRVALSAAAIFTVSDYQRNAIASKLHLSPSRVLVTYNGVSASFFEKADANTTLDVRKRYKLPERYLLFFGSTEPRKNLKGILQAYAILVNKDDLNVPDLVVKGISLAFLRKNLNELSLTSIQKRITLVEYIQANDLPVVYQMAEMLLFPSLSEGFGIPIIEAMASGTPVVTSNLTSMPEVSGDAALLVDPLSPQSIANATELLLTNPMLRKELIEKGTQRAAQFTWESSAEIVRHCYQQVAIEH
jgi:glycosyltransferase involved in cell wall biosynthesis